MSSLYSVPETFVPIPLFFILVLPIFFVFLKRKPSTFPPGPTPLPVIGNLHLMSDKPHVALAKLSQTYGPLMSVRLGGQLVVVGSSPAAASEILKTHDHELSGRYVPHVSFAKDPELNKNAVAWTVECTYRWKFLRSLTRNTIFSSKMVDAQSSIREKKVNEMINYLSSKVGENVKIRDVAFVYTFTSLANIYISRDLISYEGETSRKICGLVREMMELYATPNVSDMYPILGLLDLQGLRRKTTECVGKIREMWEHIIKERREEREYGNASGSKDFLDALFTEGFSDQQISFLFVELLAAVSDSSSSSVEWLLVELLKNPDKMKRVQDEIATEIPLQESIKESHLSKLLYLQACVKEVMRLHPPAPLLLPHRAIKDCQVMDYTIPENTQVFVNVWSISRDPSSWEDPMCFKPERFLTSELDFKGNHFEFLPFGSGRRICPGLAMSVRKIQLALASLIHNFDWSLPSGMLQTDISTEEQFGITLMKAQPLIVVPTRKIDRF